MPHNKLLYVLQNLKINPSVLKWIKHYLTNRTQQTLVDGLLSKPGMVISGVPQGSVLGPLLFILFLEDLIRRLEAIKELNVYVYADDIKLLSCNPKKLQQGLDVVEQWSVNWQLRIQPAKSEQITFCRRSTTKSSQYTINGVLIPQASSVKDLGVIISSDLKWHNYVSKICAKSISLSYLILKSFHSKDPFFFSNLFKLYIRPNLEYNVSVWNPYHIGDIKKVELVQATFTRIVFRKLNIKYDSYRHRLEILNLDTLEIRRLKLDLISIYKILHNLVELKFENFFTISPTLKLYNLRRHELHLQKPKLPQTSVRQHFFTYRTVNIWNQLPQDIVNSSSLENFKFKLNSLDLNAIHA